MDNAILSVSDLTLSIKKNLESKYNSVRVKGEISNLKRQSSGHIYFSLKDANAQISAVLFQGNTRSLTQLPKDGDQVILEGEISVYAPRGAYQLIVRKVEFDGIGKLLIELHQLKQQLHQQGFFDTARKKPLPPFPKTIGVVTSPTGAVIRDILNVLERRSGAFHLILNPVKVQGEGAAEEIALAIDDFNKHRLVDLIIVGRGGGSLEDLMPFNALCVAKSIYNSKIPIISAVGHETDFSISDYVADLRAPTPSAAAEIAVREKNALIQSLAKGRSIIQNITYQMIKQHRARLDRFASHPKFSDLYYLLGTFEQKIDLIENDITSSLQNILQRKRYQLDAKKQVKITKAPTLLLERKRESLLRIQQHLQSVNPKTILKKGYCIPFHENQKMVILGASELSPSQKISLLFHDGKVESVVETVNKT